MSERLACKAVGLARSTYRRLPVAQTPADPDADLRAWLRCYATERPCHGFRRAWATLCHDERREMNLKKVHRLWREEGLRVRVHSPRKRAGVSSVPQVAADAPKVVWALGFQFDSTIDGKAIKIASIIDEHTRESLLDLVERSITAERFVAELDRVFAALQILLDARVAVEGVDVDLGAVGDDLGLVLAVCRASAPLAAFEDQLDQLRAADVVACVPSTSAKRNGAQREFASRKAAFEQRRFAIGPRIARTSAQGQPKRYQTGGVQR